MTGQLLLLFARFGVRPCAPLHSTRDLRCAVDVCVASTSSFSVDVMSSADGSPNRPWRLSQQLKGHTSDVRVTLPNCVSIVELIATDAWPGQGGPLRRRQEQR